MKTLEVLLMIGRGAVLVPCGGLLIAVAAWIAWNTAGNWFASLFAAWIGYHGLKLIHGGLKAP
jgi:hypothetical protein